MRERIVELRKGKYAGFNDRHFREKLFIEEELAGKQTPTQVERAWEALGIEAIYANSPQAKGQVERVWQTLQDRLISELRLAGVSAMEEANRFLRRYRLVYSRRFAKLSKDNRPAWRSSPKGFDLKRTCSFYRRAHVSNDNTIRYNKRLIAIPPGPGGTS